MFFSAPSNFIGPKADVHAVTGVLKGWLRELPVPLVPFKSAFLSSLRLFLGSFLLLVADKASLFYSLYPFFIASAVGKEVDKEALQAVVNELPELHWKLFSSLLVHLQKVPFLLLDR